VLPSSLFIACDVDHDVSCVLAQAVTIALVSSQVMRVSRKRQRDNTASKGRGGSLPSKRANDNIGRGEGARKIDRDYFFRLPDHVTFTPIFDDDVFSRRYRVPRDVYERIRDGLLTWNDNYFIQKRDCCGALGASTDQKMWSAMRQLAYGLPADATVEYGRLADTTNLTCLKMFYKGVVDMFETEWLRLPNMNDAMRIERHYGTLGFPGSLGCVDCAFWEWDVCPIG
jgi:Plant transposon protein